MRSQMYADTHQTHTEMRLIYAIWVEDCIDLIEYFFVSLVLDSS